MAEHLVPVDSLRTGVYIRLDLKWFEHPFMFGSFKIKNQQQIQILKELGLTHVAYVPEKSDQQPAAPSQSPLSQSSAPAEPAPPREPSNRLWELKKERIERLKERRSRVHRCEKQYEGAIGQVKKVMQNLATGSEEAAKEADILVQDMVQTFLSEREVIVHLMNVKGKDEGTFYHALNVAILAMLLGKEYGLGAEPLRHLGLGSIFHDIGKYKIPKKLLYKRAPLTAAERELLQLHTRYGEEIASRIEGFPSDAVDIIRQHHEAMDGSGHPDRLAGEEISILSRITSIANVYDTLCNQPNTEDSLTPHEALSYMFNRLRSTFDAQLLPLFIRSLGVYPPGTVAQLSNDMIGMVVSVNPKSQLRPSLVVYDSEVPKNEALIIDLQEHPDLSITRSIRPSQLPSEIYTYLDPRIRVSYYYEAVQPGSPPS